MHHEEGAGRFWQVANGVSLWLLRIAANTAKLHVATLHSSIPRFATCEADT